eukprot:10417114-Alexandrium_andersonii.AAC.1
MSASLVGSEMCIRDRTRWRGFPPPLVVVARPGEAEATEATERKSDMPVSYTHLTLPTICSV